MVTDLLEAVGPGRCVQLNIDARCELSNRSNLQVNKIKPTITGRVMSEISLFSTANKEDVILCMGNLPPLLKSKGKVIVFLQNRHLIDDTGIKEFSIKKKIQLYIERIWFRCFLRNANHLIVQTCSMKRLLESFGKDNVPIHIMPFLTSQEQSLKTKEITQNLTLSSLKFFYPASGEPHKNHRNLILAWIILAKNGFFPTLVITLDATAYSTICTELEIDKHTTHLNIKNIGPSTYQVVNSFYRETDALIFPSTMESLGLPLLEAKQINLPVIAPELDYVRDIIDPTETFDSSSPVSIARAVRRFSGHKEPKYLILTAGEFLEKITQLDPSV